MRGLWRSCLLLLAAGCAQTPPAQEPSRPAGARSAALPIAPEGDAGRLLVIVNGEEVTLGAYRRAVIDHVGLSLLADYIDKLLVLQEARAQGIAAGQAELEAWVSQRAKEILGRPEYGGDWTKLERDLAAKGYSRQDMFDELRVGAAYPVLAEQLIGRLRASEDFLRLAYQERWGDRCEARHIFLAFKGDTVKEREAGRQEALERAREILVKLEAGADFARLAQAHSEAPSAAKGGDLGVVARGTISPGFDAVAFGLKPGEIRGPIEEPGGVQIIQVTAQRPPERAFEEVRAELARELSTRPVGPEDMGLLVDLLRERAEIQWPKP